MSPKPPIKVDSSRAAAVDPAYHWREIGPDTPRGVKLQLINRAAGVAVYSIYTTGSDWTHWQALPGFNPNERG